MPVSGYFDTPFGVAGSLQTVPDAIQSNGSVSYNQGYGILYSTPVASGGLNIARAQMNQLFYDITSALQQYQQNGIPPFITTAMNGGTPYTYNQYAMVLYGGVAYQSNTGGNADTPPSSKWNIANIGASTEFIGGTTTGTANAQVLALLAPSGFALTDGYTIRCTAGFTNTTATTLAVTSPSIAATPIYKPSPSGPTALTGNEITANNPLELTYNLAAGAFVIMGGGIKPPNYYQASGLNPASTTSTSGVMMALGGALTPKGSGVVEITVTGQMQTTGTGSSTCRSQIRYGTGSAPANGAALTGTAVGNVSEIEPVTAGLVVPFVCNAIVPALAVGTAYWFDVGLIIGTSGTGNISTVGITIKEL